MEGWKGQQLTSPTPGLLVTADGGVFRGESVGADGVGVGEVVFNTSMTGYQEILTDPSYAEQIVVMTSSHIGNYGVTESDDQASRPFAKGLVVRNLCERPSNWRSEGGLADYLRARGLVALGGVDTRRLTRYVRDHGAMPAAIGGDATESELLNIAQSTAPMAGRDLTADVTTDAPYRVLPSTPSIAKVVAYDFGIKRDILRRLTHLGLEVEVVPSSTTARDVLDLAPDGVFLSNGPGDPEPLVGPVDEVRSLLGEVPVFGICLGHQVLGLALGASTYKLPFGHHGGNHPVRRLADDRVEITVQNHGFAVDLASLPGGDVTVDHRAGPKPFVTSFGEIEATHLNLNDGTLEGMRCRDIPAFSAQFHPEAAPGPRDARGMFGDFLTLMDGYA